MSVISTWRKRFLYCRPDKPSNTVYAEQGSPRAPLRNLVTATDTLAIQNLKMEGEKKKADIQNFYLKKKVHILQSFLM